VIEKLKNSKNFENQELFGSPSTSIIIENLTNAPVSNSPGFDRTMIG
jgi:hypothetical protein